MTRIFLTLASMNMLALVASSGLGIAYLFELQAGTTAPPPDQPLGATWFMGHFAVGLFAAVFTLFVHCVIFTYFLGTGRWVKEVARAYGIPDQGLPRLTREFKRQAFPPALFAMLSAIAAAASGAAAQTESWPWWTHPLLAALTLVVNGWAFYVEYVTVSANGRVVDQVMDEVNRIRGERTNA